jgi:hypothetical protein
MRLDSLKSTISKYQKCAWSQLCFFRRCLRAVALLFTAPASSLCKDLCQVNWRRQTTPVQHAELRCPQTSCCKRVTEIPWCLVAWIWERSPCPWLWHFGGIHLAVHWNCPKAHLQVTYILDLSSELQSKFPR